MGLGPEILIVGAGPTGLALACHLLRLGRAIRLIDQKPGPSTTSKAIGLQYRVSEILACMGVADRFLARGGNPTAVNIYAADRKLVQLNFRGSRRQSGRDAFEPSAIMIPQSETEEILGDLVRERGGGIEWGTEFLGFDERSDRIVSTVRRADGSEEKIWSDWLVSCEGVHSSIRRQAGIGFTGKTYPLAFFLADVEMEGPLNQGENHVWLHQDGSFAALPLPKRNTWRLFVDVTRMEDSRIAGEALTLEAIHRIMLQRTGESRVTISNPSWISEFRIHCRMVDRYRAGRVFLAGDAAHAHSPAGGQGIITGIQDATNLAWKLARVLGGAPPSLLDTYEEERLPKAREVLEETDRTTSVLLAPSLKTRFFRDFLLLPIMRNGWVQKKMFARLSQLHVNYRGCSLSRESGRSWRARGGLRAGDRAPDVAFRKSRSGEVTTLFKLLEPMKPLAIIGTNAASVPGSLSDAAIRCLSAAGLDHCLLADNSEPLNSETECFQDMHGDFRRLYGLTGEFVCLIRPDDHIGLIQRRIDPGALLAYIGSFSPAPAR